jgi:glycine oxidase
VKITVVGGGIIGCATAYELAKAGCAVTLFERATPGAEASGAAAGLLTPLGDTRGSAYDRLALASWRLYPAVVDELRQRSGIDVEYVTRGTVYPLFDADDVRQAEARVTGRELEEFGIEAWDTADVRVREPALATQVRGAMFIGGEHWVNNQRLVVAYAQAAVGAGVVLRAGTSVSRIIVEDGRAHGVVADGDRWEADAVLLAAGAWTSALAASFGARLRVEPARGQMIAVAHVPPVLQHAIHGADVYLVPRLSGELLIGATVERVGFQRSVTAEGISSLLQAATALVPSLGPLPITRTWYGFRPWAPDSLPIFGPWPEIEGLWVATAHFRSGILLAPITAQVMTSWMTTGAPGLDVDAFAPERFLTRDRSTS